MGEIGRPVRPQILLPGGHCHFRRRLCPLGLQPHHDGADRVPRAAGPRRWRAHGGGANDHRRRGVTARAGSLLGSVRGDVRRGHRHRSPDRRPLRDLSLMALGLLHQPALRRACPLCHRRSTARVVTPRASRNRLSRNGRALRRGHVVHSFRKPGRCLVELGLRQERRPGRRRCRLDAPLPCGGAPGQGAVYSPSCSGCSGRRSSRVGSSPAGGATKSSRSPEPRS